MKEKDLDEQVLNEVRVVLSSFFTKNDIDQAEGKLMMQKVAVDLINFVEQLENMGY